MIKAILLATVVPFMAQHRNIVPSNEVTTNFYGSVTGVVTRAYIAEHGGGGLEPRDVGLIATNVVTNVVTKSYVEGLGISGGGCVNTNVVNDLIRSYDETNLTDRIAACVKTNGTNYLDGDYYLGVNNVNSRLWFGGGSYIDPNEQKIQSAWLSSTSCGSMSLEVFDGGTLSIPESANVLVQGNRSMSDYGIANAYTKAQVDGKFLQLSGGTMSGILNVNNTIYANGINANGLTGLKTIELTDSPRKIIFGDEDSPGRVELSPIQSGLSIKYGGGESSPLVPDGSRVATSNMVERVFAANADYALKNLTGAAVSLKSGEIGNADMTADIAVTLDFSNAANRSGDCMLYLINATANDHDVVPTQTNNYTFVSTDLAKALTIGKATTNIVMFSRVKGDTVLVSKQEVK